MDNNKKETQVKKLEEAMLKFEKKIESGELTDDALESISGGNVLSGTTFRVAVCKKCGWVSSPYDNKGEYDMAILAAEHGRYNATCEGDFVVYVGDTRNLIP